METDWDDYKEMMHDVRRALVSEKERLTALASSIIITFTATRLLSVLRFETLA